MGKKNGVRYREELKEQIIAEYAKKELGYKKIAQKFGMTRDAVRGIILRSEPKKCEDNMENISLENPKINNKNLDKETIEHIKNLEAKVSFLQNYNKILESHIDKDKKKMKRDAIKISNEKGFQVNRLCAVSNVAKSSYYHYLSHNTIEKKDEVIIQALMTLSKEQLMRGTKNKMDSLKDIGIKISYKRLWRICNKYGFLSDIRKRRYPKDYYPKHKQELKDSVVDNILNREFECNKPLTKLCTDITYIKIKGGKWLFLSVIIDLCTREIVSYCVSKSIDTKLAIDTVKKLKMKYCDINGCLLHSDQGCTYTSKEFHKFIIENNFIRSMSRKGNCHDNAIVENFFGTFKNESIYKETLKNGMLTYSEMEKVIDEYIEYYNNRRKQERISFKTPLEYRKELIVILISI